MAKETRAWVSAPLQAKKEFAFFVSYSHSSSFAPFPVYFIFQTYFLIFVALKLSSTISLLANAEILDIELTENYYQYIDECSYIHMKRVSERERVTNERIY